MLTVTKGCTTAVIDSLGLAFDEEVLRWTAKTDVNSGVEVRTLPCISVLRVHVHCTFTEFKLYLLYVGSVPPQHALCESYDDLIQDEEISDEVFSNLSDMCEAR